MTPRGVRALLALALLKIGISVVVIGFGFHGVSDDDFARIVIAQEFAHQPKLDPSGTSWLPLPFWITGGAMRVLGLSPNVAVGVGIALGVLSVWLVYAAARRLSTDPGTAFWSAVVVAFLPWSARLGASALPELPVAAASLYALSTLLPGTSGSARLGGAVLLLLACLSRYEPWFLAGGFALVCLWDAIRERDRPVSNVLSTVIAAAGPAAWSWWNHHAHGSPTHYLDRVAAYKQAVDQGAIFERVTSYFLAVFRAEPELVAAFLFALFVARASIFATFRDRWARPAGLLAVLLITLTASSIKGGAPTHHPERALLTLHLFLAVATVHALRRATQDDKLGVRLAVLVTLVIGSGAAVLRGTLLFKESVAARRAELAVGREVAAQVPAGEKVFLEVVDFGYFAVLAGSERPWDFVLSGKVDPAKGGVALGREEALRRARELGASHAVVFDAGSRYSLIAIER